MRFGCRIGGENKAGKDGWLEETKMRLVVVTRVEAEWDLFTTTIKLAGGHGSCGQAGRRN